MKINFNMNDTRAFSGSYQILPAGTYNVEIVKQEEKPFTSCAGTRLVLTYSVIDGPCSGSQIQDSLNLGHASEAARSFAQMRLKAIALACGKPVIYDTEELERIPFSIRLKVAEDRNGKERNEVDEYSPIQPIQQLNGVSVAQPVQAPAYQNNAPFWK